MIHSHALPRVLNRSDKNLQECYTRFYDVHNIIENTIIILLIPPKQSHNHTYTLLL